ncbi:MAG TPA: hypothetical protein VND93_09995, partial [Myxococcales bacterium]|nr:hypothetical protein [Myxococcales bacterium]
NTAWVTGTEAISVSSTLLEDDVESGWVAASSGGQWSQVNVAAPNALSASTAAAHRGTYGLRLSDADGQTGGGPQGFAQYSHAPVTFDYYFRTWFRYGGANQSGDAELAGIGSGPLAAVSLTPARTVRASGATDAGVVTSETGSAAVAQDSWHLLELFANGISTTAGVRRTYVDGVLNTTASGQDWSGLTADVIAVGEPFSADRQLVGTLDFDDLRATTVLPASHLSVAAPTTVPLNACTPVTISLRESTLNTTVDGPYDLTASLRLEGVSGALFADSTCAQPTTSASFPLGVRSTTVYLSPFAIGGGTVVASHPDLLDGRDAYSVVTGQPLAVSPNPATANPHGVVGFTAAGGSGGGYRWSFLVNRSGGTLAPGGVYVAGATPVVTDVVQVTDSLGASATAQVNVVRDLVIAPPRGTVYPFGQIDFFSSGGAGPVRFNVSDNRSSAVVDPASGLYNAGGTAGVVDVVSVVDARGSVASAPVQVLSPTDFKVNVNGSGGFTAGGSATYTFQVVDASGAAVLLPQQLQVRLAAIPGGPPLAATMTSTFAGADAGTVPSTSLQLTTNGNGFASAVMTGRLSERLFVCGALLSDPRTEACVLVSLSAGLSHHARADAVSATAPSCTPARIDVAVVDALENNVGFAQTVQVCPSAGSSAVLVSSTLANPRLVGTCLVGDLSLEGTASVFAVDGMDETVTFTATQAALTNPPVTAQVTWSGRAPSASQTLLQLVGVADPAPLTTASGSAVSVRVSPRDACGQPIAVASTSDVALQLPPPLQATGPSQDSTGLTFSVTSPSCPPLPADPLPIHAQLQGAPVTAPGGAPAEVNVLVTCRAPRFLSQGSTAAQCNQPYHYSPQLVPEVEGDGPFVFSATGLPAGASLTPAGELVWIPARGDVGRYAVQLTVVGAAGQDTQQIDIDVTCGSTVPPAPCGCGEAGAAPLAIAAAAIALAGVRRKRRSRHALARAPR